NTKPLTDNFGRSEAADVVNNFLPKGRDIRPDLIGNRTGNVGLVREIKLGFDQCSRTQKRSSPPVVKITLPAIRICNGKLALLLGLGRNQVRKRLGSRQVELAVMKGAPRKFPGFGLPRTFK